MTKYTTIKVSEETKNRLERLKKNATHNEFISKLTTFSEINGIDFSTPIVLPTVLIKEQATRIVEVVRGIEKTQNKKLAELYSRLEKYIIENTEKGETIAVQEVQILFENYAILEKSYEEKEKEIAELKTKLSNKVVVQAPQQQKINTEKALEIISYIEEKMNKDRMDNAFYRISTATFKSYINRLKEELKK